MPFDVVIRGGHLVDGTGSAARLADVGIRNGKIARVGRVGRAESAMAIEASGKYVAPGFIDIHTHSDIGILMEPTAECAVRQGVTTHVIGNCGDSPAPISEEYRELAVRRFEYYAQAQDWSWSTYGEYLDFMAAQGVGINIAGLVGHGSVRLATMGFEERPPTPDERVRMKAFVDEAMRAGARVTRSRSGPRSSRRSNFSRPFGIRRNGRRSKPRSKRTSVPAQDMSGFSCTSDSIGSGSCDARRILRTRARRSRNSRRRGAWTRGPHTSTRSSKSETVPWACSTTWTRRKSSPPCGIPS